MASLNQRELADNEVLEIIELHETFHGRARIATITGISEWIIRSIIAGITYKELTGGIDRRRGKRAEAVWRHSTRKYEEVYQ
jgi:hypothetical protein